MTRFRFRGASLAVVMLMAFAPQSVADGAGTYQSHCSSCHGETRLGGIGPALLPGNLRRLRKPSALEVIADGRPATQMPAFGDVLTAAELASLVDLIYTPVIPAPDWTHGDIEASHVVHRRPDTLPTEMSFDADPLNLFIVVEVGDHHATVLDGDRLKPIHRFPTRYALHGGPKYSPDGRFVYFGSRDGWVSKYDLYNLTVIAEIRAGINMRNIAVSSDGRYVLAANYLPHTLVLLDSETLDLLEVIPVADDAHNSSRVSAVYDAPPRQSFIVALKDMPQVWELRYGGGESVDDSIWEQSYARTFSAPGWTQSLSRRRIDLDGILDDFFFDPDYRLIIGASRDGGGQVVDIEAGKVIERLPLDGLPHLGSGITWKYNGRDVLATPNLKVGTVSVIDMQTWENIASIETLGPGFFMRSHENSRYAWVDVFFGPDKDAVHVIDKSTLEIAATLRPAPGKTAAHVEFSRDGKYALLSIWEMDGAIVVYDAQSLAEVKRLPMKKPSGKYNVYNKISGSRGTSH